MGPSSGNPVVNDRVDRENHQRHGEDHVGDAWIAASDLAYCDDDEPGDHTIHDEFEHAPLLPHQHSPGCACQCRLASILGRAGTLWDFLSSSRHN